MATDAQKRASTENWSIYILKGMHRIIIHTRPVLKPRTYRMLSDAIATAIEEIKDAQFERKVR